jgi:hypothetical protein
MMPNPLRNPSGLGTFPVMYSGATNAKFFPGFMQNRKSGPKPKDSSAQGAEKTSWRHNFGQLCVIKVAQQKYIAQLVEIQL